MKLTHECPVAVARASRPWPLVAPRTNGVPHRGLAAVGACPDAGRDRRHPWLRTLYHLAACCTLLLACAAPARAQYNYPYLTQIGLPTFTVPNPVENGFVNVANGNLHLEVPIASAPQRGSLPFAASLVYDSRIWKVVNIGGSLTWQPTNVPNSPSGWRLVTTGQTGSLSYSISIVYCTYPKMRIVYNNFVWTAPDGTKRYFPITTQNDLFGGCGGTVSSADAFAYDSSGLHMYVTNYVWVKVIARDGTIVYDGTQSTYTVKDRNGNYFASDGTDTLNRTLVTYEAAGGNCTGTGVSYCYKFLNSQNQEQRIKVHNKPEPVYVSTNFAQSGVTEYSGSFTAIEEIELPDGTSYSFSYDSGTSPGHYGVITGMTLPTGGQVTYSYSTPFQDAADNKNLWLQSRTQVGGGTWSYTPAVYSPCPSGASGCQQQVTVTRPSNDYSVYAFKLNNGAWNLETFSYNASGTVLRKVFTDYTTGSDHIRVSAVTTKVTNAGGTEIARKTEYSYDSANYGNVNEIRQWKYYTGSPFSTPDRKTVVTYNPDTAYINKNLISLPTDVQIKDGSGNTLSQATFSYDEGSLTSVTGVTHHDTTNYGSGFTTRGNVTGTGGSSPSITSTYDITGQRRTATDAKGKQTEFSYADSPDSTVSYFIDNGANLPATKDLSGLVLNAYLTKVTRPTTGNGTYTHITYYGYYYNTGKPAKSTDENSQSSYVHFMDDFDRPTAVHLPDGGEVSASYDGQTGQTVSTKLTASLNRVDETVLNALGRLIKARNSDDQEPSTPWDALAVGYDTTGRLTKISNPARVDDNWDSIPEVNTTFSYDGLNRVTTVTHPDSNAANTYYGSAVTSGVGGITSQLCPTGTYGIGFATLYKDEAGKKRQVWIDGFGRTIEVDEPDDSNNLTIKTCYSHDLRDNFTGVSQGDQARSYGYDTSSRLPQVTTPEGGTIKSYYTTNGIALCAGDPNAVCRREAPHPNQTNPAVKVTTTYTYDELNRLTQKSYNDDPQTPTVYYYYDEPSYTLNNTQYTLNNTRGRLSRTSAASGNAITLHSYDSTGRIKDYWQCVPSNCSLSTIWHSSYTYNLAGDVTDWGHPAGYTVTNSINSAERVSNITSTLSDSTHPSKLAGINYAPHGAITAVMNGCVGQGCTERWQTYHYNNRLQPDWIQLGTSGDADANYCLVYNYYGGTNPSTCDVPSQSSSGNSGSVRGYYFVDSTNTSQNHTASLTYDNLNRLYFSEATGNKTQHLDFRYDRYGNMKCLTDEQTDGYCPSLLYEDPQHQPPIANKNQIINSGYSYDAAGNLTADGTHSYQWDAEAQMRSVDSGSTMTVTYNAFGQQVKEKSGWENAFDASGQWVGRYNSTTSTWDIIGAFKANGQTLAVQGPSVTRFIHPNALGSTTLNTDHDGAPSRDILYYPWGQVWSSLGSGGAHFSAFDYRNAADLDATLFRMYNSGYGRWLSPDPVAGDVGDPQSLNRYAYVLNNPTNFTDPLGLQGPGEFPFIPPITPPISGEFPSCSDLNYSISHAECANPGCYWMGQLMPWCFPPGSGGFPGAGGGLPGGFPGNAAFPNGVRIVCDVERCYLVGPGFKIPLGDFLRALSDLVNTAAMATGRTADRTLKKAKGRLVRAGNCGLAYYGIDPVSTMGVGTAGSRVLLIGAGALGFPVSRGWASEFFGIRVTRFGGASESTNILSALSSRLRMGTAASGANWLRIAGRVAVPVAIGSVLIDEAAIGTCTALD